MRSEMAGRAEIEMNAMLLPLSFGALMARLR
jgi:hypothetical protein